MDLLVFAARLLARPAAAWMEVPGATPAERREQLIVEMTVGDDFEDLIDRQLTRSAIWWLLLAVALFPMVAVGVTLELTLGGTGGVVGQIPWGVLLFFYWMGAVTGLKFVLANALPDGRWPRVRRFARASLLAQTPDVLLALIITVGSLILIS